jgi:hypothetical protein
MLNIKETAQTFDKMLHDVVTQRGMYVPVSKDTIRYKSYLITRSPKGGWDIIKSEKGSGKEFVANVFLKISAFAVCKMHENHRSQRLDELLYDDMQFQKHYIDTLFYRKTIQRSTNPATRENALFRYEVSEDIAKRAKNRIDSQFYKYV